MASQYFLLLDGVQKGPFPVDQLKSQGATFNTMAWCKGMEKWLPARDIPELRSVIPWSPSKKTKDAAQPAQETAPPTPEKAAKPSKSSASDEYRETLLDRWNDLERRTKYIIGGVLATFLVVPTLIWAFSGKSSGGSSSKYPVVDRAPSGDENANNNANKSAAQKSKAKPANGKPPVLVGNQPQNQKLPPGRFTEDFYRLARALSAGRNVGSPVLSGVVATTAQQVSDDLKKLAAETKDPVLGRIARDVIAFRTVRPASNRSRFTGATPTGFRPERLTGRGVDEQLFKHESRQGELWGVLMGHVRTGLTQSATITPGLMTVAVDSSETTKTITTAKLIAKNTSLRELHHCTLEVTLETPWGQKTIRHFYRDRWKAGSDWALAPGVIWGADGLRQTGVVTSRFWCDEGVQPGRRDKDADRFASLVKQGLDHSRLRVEQGQYITALPLANGIANNADIEQKHRKTAGRLIAEMNRLRRQHLGLLSATKAEKAYRGKWWFGKYGGDIALTFERTENVKRHSAVKTPFNVNRGPVASNRIEPTPVSARIFDPRIPPEYKLVKGTIAFDAESRRYLLTLHGEQSTTAVNGVTSKLPETTRNYLLKQDTTEFRLTAEDGELHGETSRGDQFLFVAHDAADGLSRLADWSPGETYRVPANRAMTTTSVPRHLLPAAAEAPPSPLPWSPGEIRRLGADTKPPNARVAPVSQIRFGRNDSSIFVTYGQALANWRSRTGKLNFAGQTGSPIAVSFPRGEIVVPTSGGTRFFDTIKAKPIRKRSDLGSTVAGFSPDGKLLFTAGKNGRLEVWDRSGKKLVATKHSTGVIAVAISADNQLLFSATADNHISIWDISKNGAFAGMLEGGPSPIQSIIVAADNTRLLTVAKHVPVKRKTLQRAVGRAFVPRYQQPRHGQQFELTIWDIDSKRKVHSLRLGRNVTCVDVSADWRFALVGEQDGPISVWNLKTGVETHRLVGHAKTVRSVAISNDGRFAATGDEEGWVVLWGLPLSSSSQKTRNKSSSPSKTNPKIATNKPTETPAEKKRRSALRSLKLAAGALKAGDRISALEFVKDAERTAGDDPAVKRQIERIREDF